MTLRTLEFFVWTEPDPPVWVNATLDGEEMHKGYISRDSYSKKTLLFKYLIDSEFDGVKSLAIEVSSGTLVFSGVEINYSSKLNSLFTQQELTILTEKNSLTEEKVEIWLQKLTQQKIKITKEELRILCTKHSYNNWQNLMSLLYKYNITPVIPGGPNQIGNVPITNMIIDNVDVIDLQQPGWNTTPRTRLQSSQILTVDIKISPQYVLYPGWKYPE